MAHTKRLVLAVAGFAALLSAAVVVTLAVVLATMAGTIGLVVEGIEAPSALAVLSLLVLAGSSIAIGLVLLRFGLRVFPLRASGRRQRSVILALTIVLCAATAAAGYVLVELGELTKLPNLREGLPDFWTGGFAVVSLIIYVFVVGYLSWIATMLASLAWLFLAAFSTAILLPIASLLFIHLRPSHWRGAPYVLFLRSFRGTSNVAAVGPLVRGVRPGVRLVFLAPPFGQTTSWDPVSLGLAGFRLWRALSSIPIQLLSEDSEWRHDVRRLAADAEATVIDVSEPTPAVREEVEILRGLSAGAPVLWLVREGASADVHELIEASPDMAAAPGNAAERGAVVRYSERRFPMLIRRILAASAMFATAETVLLILLEVGIGENPPLVATGLVTLVAVTFALWYAMVTSVRRGYSRGSAAQVRAAFAEILTRREHTDILSPKVREIARVPVAVSTAAVAALAFYAWIEVSSAMDTLSADHTKTPDAVSAHRYLSRFPFIARRADRLLAAHWARVAAGRWPRVIEADERLAFNLLSLSVAMQPEVYQNTSALLAHPAVRALEMTYRQPAIAVAAFSADGKYVFVAGDRETRKSDGWGDSWVVKREPMARLWNTLKGTPASPEYVLPESDPFEKPGAHAAALSPDGSYAVIAAADRVRLFGLTDRTTIDVPGKNLRRVAISGDSNLVALVRNETRGRYTVHVFNRHGAPVADPIGAVKSNVIALQFDPAGDSILVADEKTVSLWNTSTGALIAERVISRAEFLHDAVFMPNGSSILVATNEFLPGDPIWDITDDWSSARNGRAFLLSRDTLKPLGAPFLSKGGGIRSMVMNADGTLVALGSETCCDPRDGNRNFVTLSVWRIADRTAVCEVRDQRATPVSSVAFSPDSERLAVVEARGLGVWSVDSCRQMGDFVDRGVSHLSGFRSDGHHILTTGDLPRLWSTDRLETGRKGEAPLEEPAVALESWLVRTAVRFDESWSLVPRHDTASQPTQPSK